jgi:hypothetical protein
MAGLVSPGVEVKVIDESFYTPAEPGTVPLIVITSAENKTNGSGTGIAAGTLKANAGEIYVLTSQRDLADTFGDPIFKTDVSGNPIHAGEQNEYGLQAAYSFLGVSNRVFVVRADIDLNQLNASPNEPASTPIGGTHWLHTAITRWGIFEWDARPVTVGGQKFTNKIPLVITQASKVDASTGAPKAAVGAFGDYAIVSIDTEESTPALTISHGNEYEHALYYKKPGQGWVAVGSVNWSDGGLNPLKLQMSSHTNVPQWKIGDVDPGPTGSVWIKTTTPNNGANIYIQRFNGQTLLWERLACPVYDNGHQAIYNIDPTGGGKNILTGSLFAQTNHTEATPSLVNFKIWKRGAIDATTIISNVISANTFNNNQLYTFDMRESLLDGNLSNARRIQFTGSNASTEDQAVEDADNLSAAINNAGFVNIEAEVDTQNRLVIKHKNGGEIRFDNGQDSTSPLPLIFGVYNYEPGAINTGKTRFLHDAPDVFNEYIASNWEPLVYAAGDNAPERIPDDGQLWYSSVIDEIDIMVHDGITWKGYKVVYPGVNGPIVSASAPETQADLITALVDGDIWVDTSDLEMFPQIYVWDANLTNLPVSKRWVKRDSSDQTTENGVLFADARWTDVGNDANNEASSITDLLISNFLDPDAPDPALYPKGMLLWNLRRSGFNVKQFKKNYINTVEDNPRDGNTPMASYYPHRWVTVSSNQDDGSGSFGYKAQRKVVVKALQATVNSNEDLRDDERRIFNLMACPGYPELIGELISLNYDRALTAFIVGDPPARLTPDATSLLRWASNERGANEDNDIGAASYDEYMALFYPWGFTSDNFGNNVVVPPSHMILRTLALNDQVAYPWFAPAGVRRGGITNATAVGYITNEGEFKSVALNTGQRDVLYEQKVNPITFLTGTGLVNYGQKTRARAASALDRINVARLVVYLRRQLNAMAKPYLFEPNDKITRDQIKAAAEALLLELVGLRALYDFIVVCDESNNTPSRIDRNELWLDIAIEPVKAVEFIYIPLRIKNTGEIASLGI